MQMLASLHFDKKDLPPRLAADLKVSALSILICAVEALLGMECKITLCLYNRSGGRKPR